MFIYLQDPSWDSETSDSTVLGPRHMATPFPLPLVHSVSSWPGWEHCGSSISVSIG